MKTLALLLALAAAAPAASKEAAPVPVPMPGGGAGIGFDDLGYAPALGKILVPGGRTGKIFLVDPVSRKASSLAGFSEDKDYKGGHGEGVTSADEGGGLLFGTDRDAGEVKALDPRNKKVVATVKLGGHPDYVRWVAPTREVWVSEPHDKKIEVFSLSGGPKLALAATIPLPDGPESLVVDAARGRAYAHSWKDETYAVDLKERKVAATWKNGCAGSRGIALDEKRGWLFAGCDEGKAVLLDAGKDGAILSTLASGSGVDVIAYDAKRRRLYLPGADSATMAVIQVAEDGKMSLVREVKTAKGAHCAAADARGGAWVCDPDHGRLLFVKDAD